MRYIALFTFLVLLANCPAQEVKLLLGQKLISDLSETPIYPRITEAVNGRIQWKDEFRYLDSIDIYAIAYLSDGLRVNGFLVKPKKPGTYPCIIYNRGGNREYGSLKIAHGAITLGQIAREGYVVIASQYRGNGGSEGREAYGGDDIHDVTILPKVLAEIDGADTNRIGMYGWSRGGMMTYMALTSMQKIKAVVVGGGLSDLFSNIEDRPEIESEVLSELIPDYADHKHDELEKRSAIKWVHKFPKNVPILVLHGNADWRVKPEQSLKLALEFEKNRIPYRLVMFEGGDHGISEHLGEVNAQALNWFDRFLKNDAALPNMEYH